MTRFRFIILSLLAYSVYAQTPSTIKIQKMPSDSIYYEFFPKGSYYLKEIRTSKRIDKRFALNQEFSGIRTDQQGINFYGSVGMETPINLTDTVVRWTWDFHHTELGGGHLQFFGKVRLNRITNTLTFEQQISDPKRGKRKFMTRYKILKCTFYEFIFKDVTHLSSDLTYVFRH